MLRQVFVILVTMACASCNKQVLVQHVVIPSGKVTLKIDPTQPGIHIPADFTGLSFEKGLLPQAFYLNDANAPLVKMIKLLTHQGVLRIGGNSVEKLFWANHSRNGSADVDSLYTDDVDSFFAFARATGWKVIYGLNFAQSTPARTASEASYAYTSGGSGIQAFEIGNEPDLYASNGLRAKTYTYPDFQTEWLTYYTAIHTKTPGASLAGPATAYNMSWLLPFIGTEYSRLKLATHHYYRTGPPSNPLATIDTLLAPDNRLITDVTEAVAACRSTGIPFRMAECNSIYDGGKKGVSNVFASALWGLDYMYALAALGAEGVNFHGGTSGYYSPILLSKTTASPEPLFYGMLCFQLGSQGRFIPLSLSNTGAVDITAYAVLGDDGSIYLTVINKDATNNADITIRTGTPLTNTGYILLSAASLTATTGVTLGANAVKADGAFTQPTYQPVSHGPDSLLITVPLSSAMVISLK